MSGLHQFPTQELEALVFAVVMAALLLLMLIAAIRALLKDYYGLFVTLLVLMYLFGGVAGRVFSYLFI